MTLLPTSEVLLRTDSLEELAIVRSLLEANEIEHSVHGIDSTGLSPLGSILSPFSSKPVEARIEVAGEDLERARELLSAFSESQPDDVE